MLSQKCPRCHSKRIRRGYRPTSIFSKIFFRFQLLCDNCNWEFKGFALPGFKSPKQTRSSKERRELKNKSNVEVPSPSEPESSTNAPSDSKHKGKVKKKIKIRV